MESRCINFSRRGLGGRPDSRVWVYAAGGYYYPGKDIVGLQDEFRHYQDLGYTVCKMKIGAADLAHDCDRIEAALKVVGEGNLCVDANGRFDLKTALAYAEALRQYRLFWYEEAGDPLDFEIQTALSEAYDLPTATGENLFSHQDARNLLRYGGMRPELIIFSSIAPYPMVWSSTTEHSVSCQSMVGRHGGSSRTGGIRCLCILRLVWGWAAMNPIPVFSSPSEVFPTS